MIQGPIDARTGLCGNPECRAFLDREGIVRWDTEGRAWVLLCEECASSVDAEPGSRYRRIK